MNKHLQTAIDFVRTNEYDEQVRHYLCAVIVRGGSILSVGYNRRNTNSFVEHYTDKVRGVRGYCMSTHAEHDAICKARNKINLTSTKIFIARVRKIDNTIGMARPCPICQAALYNYGVRRAFYTIDDAHYGIMSIKSEEKAVDRIVRISA